jgi:hypothetical protein
MQHHIVLKPISATYGMAVNTTVVALPSIPSNAISATIQVETQPIRACFDGLTTSVTTGKGLYFGTIGDGIEYIIEGWDNLNMMRMRSNGSTASSVNILYHGEGQPGTGT